LSGVVTDETIGKKLRQKLPPERIANDLIQLALKGSSMDNITVIVGDTIDISDKNQTISSPQPQVGGAVASDFEIPTAAKLTPAAKAALVIERATNKRSGILPDSQADSDVKKKMSRLKIIILSVVAALVIGLTIFGFWASSALNSMYFVGEQDNQITVFQGRHTSVLGFKLYWPIETRPIEVSQLPPYFQQRLAEGMVAADPTEIDQIIANLTNQLDSTLSQ
jgi:protein phosphatase